ncbi:MAG: RecX family transcriptional regulator [Paludibacteraceae bacterium]|nr:RecX family transcriptional regulator [Paludibacteraceae bacterium]
MKDTAAAYCAAAERCKQDVCSKLARASATQEQIDAVLQYLTQHHFLDEARYACAFAHDKLRFAGWGRVKIRYALRMKNVPDAAISEALASIDEEDYQSRLKSILQAKKRTLSGDDYTVRNKLMRFAASRGFEMDAVVRALG